MIKVLNILEQKSIKALKKAKKMILNEKIESKRAREALKYYVKNWNDTTHPGLLALACEAVGGDLKKAEPMQIVMLYLAAAIDLHDDVIDQSKVKNGRPTVFGKYGKDITLLLGNAMMIKGFTFLYDYSKELDSETFEKIIRIIKAELFDLGNAQLLEVDLKNEIKVLPERYMVILEKKASSIEVNTKIGALIGRGSPEEIKKLAKYGKILGVLIGLREEFIDIFEPEELKSRMENEILPLPLLYTFKKPKIRNKILSILSKTKISEKDVERIVEYVFKDNNVKMIKCYMQDLVKKALKLVSGIKNNQTKKHLTYLLIGTLEDL